MNDEPKTRGELTAETEVLRVRLAEYEKAELEHMQTKRELHRNIEALNRERERFQSLFEQAPFGMLMIGQDGSFRHMNGKIMEMFGYDSENVSRCRESLGSALPDPEDRDRERATSEERAEGATVKPVQRHSGHVSVTCKDGTVKTVRFRSVQLTAGEHLVTCEDVTEFEEAQEALRYSEDLLRTILSASPVAISYVNDRELKWTNQAMVEMFQYEAEHEYIGKQARDFYASEDEYQRVLKIFKDGLKERRSVDTEARFKRKDGSEFRGQVTISALNSSRVRKGIISVIVDVTGRKHAEEELHRSQVRYRTLVEESFDGIFVQTGTRITFASTRLHRMLGYDDGELVGLDHWLVYHPDYYEITRGRAQARMRGEEVTPRYEVKIQRKDGSCFDAEINAKAVMFENEPGVQVWIKDITERRSAEAALRESEERFRRLSQAAEEGIVIHDRGVLVDANEAFARMFGYELSELIGTDIRSLATPESWEMISRNIEAGDDKPYEAMGIRRDGSLIYGQIVAKPFQYRGKDVRVACINNITERKKIEAALRNSREEFKTLYEESRRAENLYRSLLNSSADAVVVCDLDGKVHYVNESFTRIFGWTMDEVRGGLIPFVPESERESRAAAIEAVAGHGTPCSGLETKRSTKDGRLLDISMSASRYHDHEGRASGILIILRDITENKRLEEQLRQSLKMEAIGRLAGGVAHDFNNLLTGMMGYANMLAHQLPKAGSHHDKVAQIQRAAERAAALTQQLLAFGRKQVLEIRPLNLNVIIEDFENMLRTVAGEGVQVLTVLDPAAGTVCADPGQIEQILMNLAVNARDAMPAGGRLTIETANVALGEEYVRSYADLTAGDYVMFAASDTGRGIPADTLSRVFDPFFTTKEKGLGTGLGLSTVYGIVKQHHGHVSVYSEPDRGTTFKVYLPRVAGEPEWEPMCPAPASRPRGSETVMVVEDEEIVRSLVAEALEALGYTPLTAADPIEARMISDRFEGPIHLLVTDVVLPRSDGKSLFQSLSQDRPDMKVLYVSGYTENFIVHRGVLEPGVHFLQKPFTVDSLAAKIRRILDQA